MGRMTVSTCGSINSSFNLMRTAAMTLTPLSIIPQAVVLFTFFMSAFIETDIFLFHVQLQVLLPHYQPIILSAQKLLLILIQ